MAMRETSRRILALVAGVSMLYLCTLVFSKALFAFSEDWPSTLRVPAASFLLPLAMLTAMYPLHRLRLARVAAVPFRHARRPTLLICLSAGAGIPLLSLALSYPFGHYIISFSEIGPRNISSAFMAFGGALGEEIIYRVVLTAALAALFRSIPIGALFQILIFAMMHRGSGWDEPMNYLYYSSGGLFLTTVLFATSCLWCATLAHGALNCVIMLLYGGKWQLGGTLLVSWSGPHDQITAATLTLSSLFVLWMSRTRIKSGAVWQAFCVRSSNEARTQAST